MLLLLSIKRDFAMKAANAGTLLEALFQQSRSQRNVYLVTGFQLFEITSGSNRVLPHLQIMNYCEELFPQREHSCGLRKIRFI